MTQKILTLIAVIVFSFAFTYAPIKTETNPESSALAPEVLPADEEIIEISNIEEEISSLYTTFSEKIQVSLHLKVSAME